METIHTFSTMHTDHRYWKNDNAAWRCDSVRWQEEYAAILTALEQLRQTIQQHGTDLHAHVDSINSHEAALELHERTMGRCESEGQNQRLDQAALESHEQQAIRHLDQRQTHERIKRQHYALVAKLEMLRASAGLTMT